MFGPTKAFALARPRLVNEESVALQKENQQIVGKIIQTSAQNSEWDQYERTTLRKFLTIEDTETLNPVTIGSQKIGVVLSY